MLLVFYGSQVWVLGFWPIHPSHYPDEAANRSG